jgi:RNA polymerase sigma-70 factor (ECF subfamily)
VPKLCLRPLVSQLVRDAPQSHSSSGTPSRAARLEAELGSVLEPAYRLALRLTGGADAAEELLRRATLAALREFRSYPGTNFRVWFFRLVVGCREGCARVSDAPSGGTEWEDTPDLYLYARSLEAGWPVAGADPAAELMERLGSEGVAQAIGRLPEAYRSVAALYFMDDLSYREIGAVLGWPAGAVRSRLHRGRKMLQKALWQVAAEAGLTPGSAGGGSGR